MCSSMIAAVTFHGFDLFLTMVQSFLPSNYGPVENLGTLSMSLVSSLCFVTFASNFARINKFALVFLTQLLLIVQL